MLCQSCQTEGASCHALILNGKLQEALLCPQCAQGPAGSSSAAFSLEAMLSDLDNGTALLPAALRSCSQCRFTEADFKKTGRLGCPQCYAVFSDLLGPILKRSHAGPHHQGKTPRLRQP